MFHFKTNKVLVINLGALLTLCVGCLGEISSNQNLKTSLPESESLVVHYTFDDVNDGVITDSSSMGNDAYLVGDVYLAPGYIGKAMRLNGEGFGILQNAKNLPEGSEERTIAFWVKADNLIPGKVMAGYGSGYTCQNFQIGSDLDTGKSLSFYGWAQCDFESDYPMATLIDGEYHHIVYSYDGLEVSFYVDGIKVYTESKELITSKETLCIGGEVAGQTCDRLFSGEIDDFRIYNRALNDSEINSLHSHTASNGSDTETDPNPNPDPDPDPDPEEEPNISQVKASFLTSTGETLPDLSELSPGKITIKTDVSIGDYLVVRADIESSTVRSVIFSQNGMELHTENNAPYEHRLGTVSSPHNYIKLESGTTKDFTVRFYTQSNGEGELIEEQTYQVNFTGKEKESTPAGGSTPTPGSEDRNYDMKFDSQFGSENLNFKRFASSKLCKQLAIRSDEFKDTSKFSITVDGVKYPVINAPKRFGIQRNSGNQQAALQNAFNKVNRGFVQNEGVSGTGEPVIYFPKYGNNDVYSYNNVLNLPNSNVILCGSNVTLKSLDALKVALFTRSSNVHIVNFRLIGREDTYSQWPERFVKDRSKTAGKYGSDLKLQSSDAARIKCGGCKNLVVAGNYMLGGRGGLRIYGGDNIFVYDNHVERTQSDGIHVVTATRNAVVANNRVVNSGDDCISVVLYNGNNQNPNLDPVRNVLVEGNDCWGSRARGLTIIGGDKVTQRGNYVKHVTEAGILLFSHHEYSTDDVSNILVTQNLVEECYMKTTNEATPYAGGISLMGEKDTRVRNAVVYKNVLLNTLGSAPSQIRFKRSEYIHNVRFEANQAYGTKPIFNNRPSGNGIVFENNSHSQNQNPAIDKSKFGSTLNTQIALPYLFD